jgi:hypothetical protein
LSASAITDPTPTQAGPGKISSKKLASITGLTDRRHRQLADQGYFPAPIRGLYETTATLSGLFRYYHELARKKNDKLKQEQTALTKARRERAEEELAILRGEYVRISELGPSLRNFALQQRATLQRKLEIELGPRLPGKTYPEIQKDLADLVDQICKIMEEGTQDWTQQTPAAPTTTTDPTTGPK